MASLNPEVSALRERLGHDHRVHKALDMTTVPREALLTEVGAYADRIGA